MKARVKATGDIVDVHRLCMLSQGDIWQKKSGKEYFAYELDFDVKEPPKPRYNPDYWTRLEHQYAGMAMNALLLTNNVRNGDLEGMRECNTNAMAIAHALVEKLKESK